MNTAQWKVSGCAVRCDRRGGFTLVELLVVIAIIGVLIAMLLPAVQMAREAARRSQCTNNLHNWGIGILNYESTNKWLPYGRYCWRSPLQTIPTRHSWVPQLWPFVEQSDLFAQYDFTVSFFVPANSPSCAQQLSLYFCPSDRRGRFVFAGETTPSRSRGNYALNLSNGYFVQELVGPFPTGITAPGTSPTATTQPYGPSPFVINNQGWPPLDKRHAMRELTDGASKTMFMSETVQASNDNDLDIRGDIFNDQMGGAHFMTVNTPNAGVDRTLCQGLNSAQLPGPCTDEGQAAITYVSARSKHPGGVMVLLGDGSVRFVVDEVNLQLWQALGTMNTGEVISAASLNL